MFFRLCLIFCFYLPFQLALNPSSGIDLASGRVFILLLFFVWLLEGLKNRKLLIGNSLANFFAVCFLAVNLFSLAVAKNTDWSARKLLFLFSVFPLYFVFSTLADTKEKLERVMKTLVVSGFVVATMALVQFFFQFIFGLNRVYLFWAAFISPVFLGHNVTAAVLKNPSWLVNISGTTYLRAVATFPDPHMLAFFLGMLLPLALGLYLKSKRMIYLVAFFVMFLADLLTFSRGGYLGLFAGFLLAIGFLWNRLGKSARTGFGVVFLAGAILLFVPGPISERFVSIFNFKEGSNMGRIETWKKAGKIIGEHPFFGVGIGNYALEIDPKADYRDPIYAHSLYLDVTAETGLIGLLAWLGFLAALSVGFLKKASRETYFFWLFLSLVVFSAHALVETPLYSPIILPLFLIIASLGVVKITDEKNN